MIKVPKDTPLFAGAGPLDRVWTVFFGSLGERTRFLSDTHDRRVKYSAKQYPVGAEYFESDRKVTYVLHPDGKWKYSAGTMRGPFAGIPTDLAEDDEGFLYFITTGTDDTEYHHLARWTGTEWEAEGAWGNRFSYFATGGPVELGWQLCDGSATKWLDIDAGAIVEVDITLADETAGLYRKSAAAYTGTPAAAVAPTVTGTVDPAATGITLAGTTGSATTGITTTGPSATVNINGTGGGSLLGTPASGTHTHSITDPGHAHTSPAVTDPTHTHTMTDLEIADDGEPAHLALLPYFRR